MVMEYEKSGFSSEDIERYALTEGPSTVPMIDGSANLDNGGETGSTVTRDILSDATSEKHSAAPAYNDDRKDEMENSSGGGSGAGTVSYLTPVTEQSYGGGLYGADRTPSSQDTGHASDFQSAEGLASDMPSHKEVHEPPSSGDRATDITGISYIQ